MRSKVLIAVVALLGLSRPVHAQTTTACWNRNIERLDYYTDPPEKGDNNFFTAVSTQNTTTNVTLLYPTSRSLAAFPQKLYKIRHDMGGGVPTGCGNQYLNTKTYFMPTTIAPQAGDVSTQGVYSASKSYPDPGPYYASGTSDGLVVGNAYRYLNWPVEGVGAVSESYVASCLAAGGGSQQAACLTCLNSFGYWLNPTVADNDVSTSAGVFTTNFLRFYPTKWTLLDLAYKRLVQGPLLSILREAVVASNGTTGGKGVQKMLPQSCNGAGRPMNQKVGAIDGLSYTGSARPISEMLFNTGWFMADCGNGSCTWPFSNAATLPPAAMNNGRAGPCNNCSGDFIVLFTDGRGDTANTACTAYADGGTPPACGARAACSTLGMGVEDDGNDFLDPSLAGGTGSAITGSSVRQMPGGTCDMDFADDVAYWLANTGILVGGYREVIKTFVVAIGDPDNTYNEMTSMKATAIAGGGVYVVADNYAELEANIETVLNIIISRATSFSAAAITTVQTHGYTSAFIPRFVPSGLAQWKGTLARYNLFNEFAAGCSSADYSTRTAANPNGDTNCNDIYLEDSNNDFIGEDSNGAFVRLNTTGAYDAGWPIIVTADGGVINAAPFWEASAVLTSRENAVIAGSASQVRTIFTVNPSGTRVPFTVANVAALAPMMTLGGPDGDFCTTLGNLSRDGPYVTENDCAIDVIRFIHGEDVLRQNPYNRTNPQPSVLQARPNILGDIFHSTPVLVSPPVATYLCDLGVANQCMPTLYSPTLEPNGDTSYQSYYNTYQYRKQIVVVGSNDGMLHAFNAANDSVVGTAHTFDLGTGKEEWAFIPPSMMPKLIRYVVGERHELLVDGTPMVRDVWVDGSGATVSDGRKQADEFHTVVVIGQREGGRSYSALDVTDPNTPKYLWSWPPAGTTEALSMGASWADLGPAAPPIGPIAEYSASGTFSVNGTPAAERYIVALGGGHDPAYLRGRGLYFLDVYSGAELYRYAAQDATSALDLRTNLWPVAAPVSLIDSNFDGLFDTAVVGDTGGQVWTVSAILPAVVTSGSYSNWYTARSFVEFDGLPFYRRSPFFQRAAAGVTPAGNIRIFLGAGDRDAIKDANGGTCGLNDLSACLRKGCGVSVSSSEYRAGAAPSGGSSGHYYHQGWTIAPGGTAPINTLTKDSAATGNSCSDVDDARLSFTLTCGASTATYASTAYCDWSPGVDGGSECPVDTGRPPNANLAYTAALTMEYSRFYSFQLFNTSTRTQFSTAAGALVYDTNRLTDSNLINANITTAADTANGWYLEHANSIDEKTSSAGLLLGGCVLWNTVVPNPVTTVACGGTLPLDTAYTYQADGVSGAIACGMAGSTTATSTTRFKSRSTYVAPQQPAMVVSVNSTTGDVAYGAVSIEPGAPPVSINVGTSKLSGSIHWLEVPRKVHECRHNGTNCN